MKQAHSVRAGEVYCAPKHKVVDVTACFGCERLIEIDVDSRRPKVVCAINPEEEAPSER